MKHRSSRRQFLQRVGWAAGTAFHIGWRSRPRLPRMISPNERMRLGIVGVGGHGAKLLKACADEQIQALCDVDQHALNLAHSAHPQAALYTDFRRMLDLEKLDGVIVATADHAHAVICSSAIRCGCHVYCAGPLARTVSEVRRLSQLAAQTRCVTQVGESFASHEIETRALTFLRNGELGIVTEAHAWSKQGLGELDGNRIAGRKPDALDFELWLGPQFSREYHPALTPGMWRHWWDFGGGTVADAGVEPFSFIHRALGLTAPDEVESEGPALHLDFTPSWMSARWKYRRKEPQSRIVLKWNHGDPSQDRLLGPIAAKASEGILFIGSQGSLVITPHELTLQRPDELIGRPLASQQHQGKPTLTTEWRQACRDSYSSPRRFEVVGGPTESILLANVAFRTDRRLIWDSKNAQASNLPDASDYLQHSYKPGWEL